MVHTVIWILIKAFRVTLEGVHEPPSKKSPSTLPKLHIKWNCSAKIHINETPHLIYGENWTLYFKGGYRDGIVMTFCDMEMLHIHTKYVIDGKSSFTMQLFLFENFHFQFILILGRVLISQKNCGNSTFSLHILNFFVSVCITIFQEKVDWLHWLRWY